MKNIIEALIEDKMNSQIELVPDAFGSADVVSNITTDDFELYDNKLFYDELKRFEKENRK